MLAYEPKHELDSALAESSQDTFDSGESRTDTLALDGHRDPENPYNWPISQKWALTCLAAFTTFLTMMNGTIITVAHFETSELFSIDESAFPHSYWPVTTWALGGACSALFILPLAEDLGTRPVFLTTYLLFICFLIPQAVAQNFASLVITRFFCGRLRQYLSQYGSRDRWQCMGHRMVEDNPRQPLHLGLHGWEQYGPVMRAAIFHSLSWRWISYMQLIWLGTLFPVYYFFFYESRGDVILGRRARANGKDGEEMKHKASPSLGLQKLAVSAKRPVMLFCTEPVLFVSTLWSAFTVGTLFLFTQSIEQVFMDLYGWSVGQVGFVQCAIVIGESVGWSLNSISRKLYFASALQNTEAPGTPIPEARIYMSVLGGVFGISCGMFIYAWTSYSSIPWIAPTISLGMIGTGSVLVVTGVSDYVVDVYSQYAGSAMGPVATGENIFSAFLPLATMSMYNDLGFNWASTLLAFISLVLSLVPTLMFFWGKEVRAQSKFIHKTIQNTDNPPEIV